MTQRQYKELCKIFKKELTEKDLKKMGFGKVDGKFNEAINEDIALYKVEECRRMTGGDGMSKDQYQSIMEKLKAVKQEIEALPESSANGLLIDAASHAKCSAEHLQSYFNRAGVK